MRKFLTRKRLSMIFCGIGVGLMGVDLFMTRNIFTHVGELMAASIICLIIGLILDRTPAKDRSNTSADGKVAEKARS